MFWFHRERRAVNTRVCLLQSTTSVDHQLRSLITERLESRIDPFDLDVFSPHIHTHLTRQTQRSTVRSTQYIHDSQFDLIHRFVCKKMSCRFTVLLQFLGNIGITCNHVLLLQSYRSMVCLSVCHFYALCSNGRRYWHNLFSIRHPHVSTRSRLNLAYIGQHFPPQIVPQSGPPVDLSVGDIWLQIAAEWLEIVQWLQWRAYGKSPSLFQTVQSLALYDLPFHRNGGSKCTTQDKRWLLWCWYMFWLLLCMFEWSGAGWWPRNAMCWYMFCLLLCICEWSGAGWWPRSVMCWYMFWLLLCMFEWSGADWWPRSVMCWYMFCLLLCMFGAGWCRLMTQECDVLVYVLSVAMYVWVIWCRLMTQECDVLVSVGPVRCTVVVW